MRIKVRDLTPEQFAPYGQVLMSEKGVPERKAWAADVQNYRKGALANVTYMSLEASHYPVRVRELERHPLSHQLFVPLNGTAHLLLVCPSNNDGSPNLSKVAAFQATGGQCVNYNANTWHAPRTVLHQEGEFIMLRWDIDDSAENTEVYTLPQAIIVDES